MVTVYTYYKNHDTQDLIKSQEFTEVAIKGLKVNWYRENRSIDDPDLKGYVTISEKTFNRLTRKTKPI